MLAPDQILAIRASRASYAALAKKYGVSKSTIANIKTNRTYRVPMICPLCKRDY